MINTLFKSENIQKKSKIGKFYVSNAEKFIEYIKNNNLYCFYDVKKIQKRIDSFGDIDYNDLNGYQQEIYNKYKENRDIISKYSDIEYQKVKEKEEKRIKKKNNKNKKDINTNNKEEIDIDKMDINTTINEIKKKFRANDFFIDISNFELENIDYTYERDSDDEFDRNSNNLSIKETIIVNDNNEDIVKKEKSSKMMKKFQKFLLI